MQERKPTSNQPESGTSAETPKESPPWSILPDVLWFVLAVAVLLAFRRQVTRLFETLAERASSGAPMRFGGIEIGGVPRATSSHGEGHDNKGLSVAVDDGTLGKLRSKAYERSRGVMLVHRLARSSDPRQLYDAILYVIPRKGATIVSVREVSYYLGSFWSDQVFTTADRARGFPLAVSAYGPFLALARITFTDGKEAVIHRFIDFEMGDVAPTAVNRPGQRGRAGRRRDIRRPDEDIDIVEAPDPTLETGER